MNFGINFYKFRKCAWKALQPRRGGQSLGFAAWLVQELGTSSIARHGVRDLVRWHQQLPHATLVAPSQFAPVRQVVAENAEILVRALHLSLPFELRGQPDISGFYWSGCLA